MKFAECMRDNGVSEFPDPDASGELTIDGVLNGSSLDPSTPAWKKAIAACKDLQPPGFTGGKRTPEAAGGAPRVRPVHPRERREGLPGPGQREPLVDTNRIPSSAPERWHDHPQRRDAEVRRSLAAAVGGQR